MRWKGMMGRPCLVSKSIEIFPRPCTGESPFTYSIEFPNLILCQLTISSDYLLDQVLKFYGICLITKLTFDKSTWELDYSSRGGGSQTLLVILMIWWYHGIPEHELYDYFPKGLLSLLPTFAFPKILSETSFLRAPQGKEMSRTTSSGSLLAENFFWSRVFLWSNIPWVPCKSIAQRRQQRRKRPRNRQRNPNWGHCCPVSHKCSDCPHTWIGS